MVLAAVAMLLAPPNVGATGDRVGYEYVAQHGLAASCPHNIYCYRVLVPSLLRSSPLPEVETWRVFTVAANALTGSLLAVVAFLASSRGRSAGLLAAILFQTSFGATFALFDPFTPDAAVYALGAALALCWLLERPFLAALIALVGVFAKETVALVLATLALAAFVRPKSARRYMWLTAAVLTCLVVVAFHSAMDAFFGWSEAGSASGDLLGGSWLRLWLSDPTLTASARLLYLFIPFGFGWLWAALGFRLVPDRLRSLAVASVPMAVILVYVQTPERALAVLSYVVVPLAATYLGRLPLSLGLAAALTNGLLTMRVGLATEQLAPVSYLLIVAVCVAAAIIVRAGIASRPLSGMAVGSSRTTSIK